MTIYTKAKFITFEGGEGSGKTTQSKLLYEYLTNKGIQAILTREIGGTKEAEQIREIILYNKELFPMTELMLVMAARYEHIHKIILPALKNNIWVICDRFIDSTACYQGQYIGMEKIYSLHREIMSEGPLNINNGSILSNKSEMSLMPDITFFIDILPEVALKRTFGRDNNNKFEDKEMEFHQIIYKNFHKIADKFNERIVKINANLFTKEEIHQQIITYLNY